MKYVLLVLSVSELLCLQLDEMFVWDNAFAVDFGKLAFLVDVSSILYSVFILEGRPVARMQMIDYAFGCPLLQYTTYMCVGSFATKHQWKPIMS